MISSYSELRSVARDTLRGNWGMAILVAFLYTAIMSAVGYIPLLGVVAMFVLGGPFTFGYFAYFLQLHRGQRPELGVLFGGFQRFGPTLVLYLLMSVFIFLWSLLLIIPGIIASFRYAMAFYIMHDDPNVSAMDALRRSSEMMKGYKLKLFVLYLTFFGWFLLSCLTLGIGFLWLMPYAQAAMTAFYEQVRTASVQAEGTYTA